jgi:hypothetical protein
LTAHVTAGRAVFCCTGNLENFFFPLKIRIGTYAQEQFEANSACSGSVMKTASFPIKECFLSFRAASFFHS